MTNSPTHKIVPLGRDSLETIARIVCRDFRAYSDNDYKIKLFEEPYKAEIIRFPKGKKLPAHTHVPSESRRARPLYKILLEGRITYQDGQEELSPMQLAIVDEYVLYDGEVMEDSTLLLLTPIPSAITYQDPQPGIGTERV